MANASYRYTGTAYTIIFNGVTVSNDYTKLTTEYTKRIEERTAGSEVDASFNQTITEGKASLEVFPTGENGTAVRTALRTGTEGNLQIFDKGNTSGKPREAFPAIVTSNSTDTAFDKNVVLKVEFTRNGANTYLPGDLVP